MLLSIGERSGTLLFKSRSHYFKRWIRIPGILNTPIPFGIPPMSIERGRCVGSQMCQNPKPCRDAFLLSCACFFRRRILIPAYLHPTYPTSFGFLIEAIEQDLLRPPGGDLFCFQVCFWALGAVAFTPHLLCKLGVWGSGAALWIIYPWFRV